MWQVLISPPLHLYVIVWYLKGLSGLRWSTDGLEASSLLVQLCDY